MSSDQWQHRRIERRLTALSSSDPLEKQGGWAGGRREEGGDEGGQVSGAGVGGRGAGCGGEKSWNGVESLAVEDGLEWSGGGRQRGVIRTERSHLLQGRN